jgi:hypothetical protein
MLKRSSNVQFSIKLIMSLNFKILIFLFLVLALSACSRSKGYFSNYVARNVYVDKQEPQLLASRSQVLPIQSSLVSPSQSLVLGSVNQSVKVHNVQSSSRNLNSIGDRKIQKKVLHQEVVQTIRNFKAQNKLAEKKSGANHWEPRLKIGVTLLVIGIVLSVFGLGLIGGISAFVGLLFTILGLLHTYY